MLLWGAGTPGAVEGGISNRAWALVMPEWAAAPYSLAFLSLAPPSPTLPIASLLMRG